MTKNTGRFLLIALAMLPIIVPAAPAQEAEEPEEKPAEPVAGTSEAPVDRPPSYYAYGDPPLPVEKIYDEKFRKVWSAVSKVLDRADIPIETEERERGYLKTKLIDFGRDRKWNRVATPGTHPTPERPILQRRGMNSGRFSVEIHVTELPDGTSVSMHVYLEERAMHLEERRKIWVERYSSGKIEGILFEKIDELLD